MVVVQQLQHLLLDILMVHGVALEVHSIREHVVETHLIQKLPAIPNHGHIVGVVDTHPVQQHGHVQHALVLAQKPVL